MKWHLDIDIPNPARHVHHRDPVLLIGSCFTENIGKMLGDLKFDTTYNPTGILFDPDSVCRHLNDFVNQRYYKTDDFFQDADVWHSWNHHSKFSNVDVNKTLEGVNDAVKLGSDVLRRARWCVVTLGSSFSYRLNTTSQRVANCHKIPQTAFTKDMMTTDETFNCLQSTFNTIRKVNPKIEFILTVSPVRHSRDGLVENNRSKARLLEAVHQLVETHDFIHYFPAYELVIDVLRDYRFYDVDMVHPNYAATQFVFEKFCNTWLDAETNALVDEIKPIVTAINHKPQHPETDAHRKFLKSHHERTLLLSKKMPWCDWEKELKYFKYKLSLRLPVLNSYIFTNHRNLFKVFMKKIYAILIVFLVMNSEIKAQCTYLIPANVNLISEDSTVDCSFLVTQTFLVCPGATLTMKGNSTCFNKFFLETGASIVFNDTFPVPYGSFSFYLKTGSTLHYNNSAPQSFHFIDTLVYEAGVTMTDTGQIFHDSTFCTSLVFDYSLLSGTPCVNPVSDLMSQLAFSFSPNPFNKDLQLNLQNNSSKESEMRIYDLLGKEVEYFIISNTNSTTLKMNNDWNGLAIVEIRTFDNTVGRKMIYRNNP